MCQILTQANPQFEVLLKSMLPTVVLFYYQSQSTEDKTNTALAHDNIDIQGNFLFEYVLKSLAIKTRAVREQ